MHIYKNLSEILNCSATLQKFMSSFNNFRLLREAKQCKLHVTGEIQCEEEAKLITLKRESVNIRVSYDVVVSQ